MEIQSLSGWVGRGERSKSQNSSPVVEEQLSDFSIFTGWAIFPMNNKMKTTHKPEGTLEEISPQLQ